MFSISTICGSASDVTMENELLPEHLMLTKVPLIQKTIVGNDESYQAMSATIKWIMKSEHFVCLVTVLLLNYVWLRERSTHY
jgi:hypothetical protein